MLLNHNYIILDIETVVDEEAILNSSCVKYGFDTLEEYKTYQQDRYKKSFFAKPLFHKIRCIGLLFVSGETLASKYIDFAGDDEKEILQQFWRIFSRCLNPVIVGFNSKSFDIPVINLRSGKYISDFESDIIEAMKVFNDNTDKWEKFKPNYLNNYSKYHIDLIENTGYPRPSLLELCEINGIKVKTTSSGSDVENMTMDEIKKYCHEDVFSTARLWTRKMLQTDAEFDISKYRCLNDVLDKLE